jgi:hypothetical protein
MAPMIEGEMEGALALARSFRERIPLAG